MTWKHQGGGTMLGHGGETPCDDAYENLETGKSVILRSTVEAHFKMPDEVDDINTLLLREGVREDCEFKKLEAVEEKFNRMVRLTQRPSWCIKQYLSMGGDYELDNEGQKVIYTGEYEAGHEEEDEEVVLEAPRYLVHLDCLVPGDQGLSKTVAVTYHMFMRMKPHEDEYGRGSHPHEVQDCLDFAYDRPDLGLTDEELDAHPDDRFLYVAVC